jgi:hypothetical protein
LRSRLGRVNRKRVMVKPDQHVSDTLSSACLHSSVRPARSSLPPAYVTHPRVVGLENFDRNAKSTWRPPRIPGIRN